MSETEQVIKAVLGAALLIIVPTALGIYVLEKHHKNSKREQRKESLKEKLTKWKVQNDRWNSKELLEEICENTIELLE